MVPADFCVSKSARDKEFVKNLKVSGFDIFQEVEGQELKVEEVHNLRDMLMKIDTS
jgi:hypothetical protein